MSASGDIPKKTFNVAILSWNVGNAEPPTDLSSWLKGGLNGEYDLIAIGVQECLFSQKTDTSDSEPSPLSKSKSLLKSPKTLHDKRKGTLFWSKVVALLPAYSLVAKKRRLEMELRVYALKDLVACISRITVSNEATGLGHVIGNKGGIAIALVAQDTSFCFLSAHFAAHQEKVLSRRENYYEIVSNLRLGRKSFEVVNQFDYFYWMGDLNYRIDDLTFEQTLALATRGDEEALRELYLHDQLQKELDGGHIFHRFAAPVPAFPPTYRMKKNVHPAQYNPDLGRIPSWCDRVLVQTCPNPRFTAELGEFVSCGDIVSSDHTPIRATFSNPLRHKRPEHSKSALQGKSSFEIVLSGMSGTDLFPADPNGLSDPFLKFSCPKVVKKKAATHHIAKTLNPVWDETIVLPVLSLITLEMLQEANLMVEVYDLDKTSRNDRMGQFMLSLLEPATSLGTEFPFKVQVIHHGKPAGFIQGNYQIRSI